VVTYGFIYITDHDILLLRLHMSFFIKELALQWFQSYLLCWDGRSTYDVEMPGELSSRASCGVPQGSVSGPTLFIMYTADLVSVIECHGLSPQIYTPTIHRFTLPAVLLQSTTFRRGSRTVLAPWRCFQLDEVQQVVTELRQNRTSVVCV